MGPVYSLGQLVGGLIAAFFLDKFGRKITLFLGALCMITSTALLVWSPGFAVVIVARIIEGISIGFLLLGYQIYAVEIAAKEDRGFVSSFSLMTGNFFGLLAAGLIFGISYDQTNTGWRVALAITFIPATTLLIALPFIPESPRFLFQQGKEEQCRRVLVRLYGGSITESGEVKLSEQAETEFEAMRAAITWDIENNQHKWSSLWNTKAARYRSWVAFTSQSWWAWNGQSVFTYYYTQIFRAAGITDTHVQFGVTAVQNASWCVGGIVGGYLLDIWGRRTNYLIGLGQACVCLVIQGALTLGIFDKGITNHAAGAAFVSVYLLQWFLWVMFYSPGESASSSTTYKHTLMSCVSSREHASCRSLLCRTSSSRLRDSEHLLYERRFCFAVFRSSNVPYHAWLDLDLLCLLHGGRFPCRLFHIPRDQRSESI